MLKYQVETWNKTYKTATLKESCITAHDICNEFACVVSIHYIADGERYTLITLDDDGCLYYTTNGFYKDFYNNLIA